MTSEKPEIGHDSQNDDSLLSQEIDKTFQSTEPTPRASDSDLQDMEILEGDREELRRLATGTLSRQQTYQSNTLTKLDSIAGIDLGDEIVNPNSPNFNPYKWARVMVRQIQRQELETSAAGITFKNLTVTGTGSALNLQNTVADVLISPLRYGEKSQKGKEKVILNKFNGVVRNGELCIVLGRPGAGCSTFLKTVTGETHGVKISKDSTIHYNGIPQDQMLKEFKGELTYNMEVDKHFAHLSVGQTLEFAAAARTSQARLFDMKRDEWVTHITKVIMAIFGLSHTYNTKVGSDNVRGVSGGERKRVSIAEMALAGAPIAAWDNSTRGLDSATALEFVRSLKMASDLAGVTQLVAIYQASQAIYDIFEKAVVLYEGRQIYFGPANRAKAYFETMGWDCPSRQTTGDFLTSVTNPTERRAKAGFENRVPRTPDEFEKYWLNSPEYKMVLQEIDQYEQEFPVSNEGGTAQAFKRAKNQMQAKGMRAESPYVISVPMQIKLNMKRHFQRMKMEPTPVITRVVSQVILAFIIGSMYYGGPKDTGSFFAKGGVIFFACLLSALNSVTEINTLYDQRPIVEKQTAFAFYHPFTEALAGMVSDIPVKLVMSISFNVILYFLAGLRTDSAAPFFVYFLFTFMTMLCMSAIFRSLAAATKTLSQAMSAAGVMVLAIVIYTGYTIPRTYMKPWFKWLSWINPVAYSFEALLANEVHGKNFPCAPTSLVPAYPNMSGNTFICGIPGATAGANFVSGDDWLHASYDYSYSHVWRNFGIVLAFFFFFMAFYLVCAELNNSTTSTAEVLVFRRGHAPKHIEEAAKNGSSPEDGQATPVGASRVQTEDNGNVIPPQNDIYTWKNVSYEVPVKEGTRKLLDNVSGYVKPGELIALMGVSGAGKTTLLDVLSQRTSVGVITGDMLVNGKPRDPSFQRKTGYVMQGDIHLETSTVREALQFSAMCRQPKTVSKKDKHLYVEEVIKMLNMDDFAEAVVGVPGEGLNVEQRKLLTIGVELAAKPNFIWLDEPTSGLDSQSSWAIVQFMRKLANNNQAVISTIHQPSAILFEQFDRLLFLAKGGKTVYFGNVGANSRMLLDYFESHGARKCTDTENPAEYMLEIVNAGSSGKSGFDWHEIWKTSEQSTAVVASIDTLHNDMKDRVTGNNAPKDHSEFAMPFHSQLFETTKRVFQQYWRSPNYIWSKIALSVMSALFIGFSFFQSDSSQRGLQQIIPNFVSQRTLYETRERPSKVYSWKAFLFAQMIVELPWQALCGVLVYASFYYPVFGIQSSERQGLVLLFTVQFFIYTSTFAQFVISGLPDAETAGSIGTLMFSLTLTFCGVMQTPDALPRFWIFMYRVSPLTYLVAGIAGTSIAGREVICSSSELAVFQPPNGSSCGTYMEQYLTMAPGRLYNPDATSNCQYCPITVGDEFLAGSKIFFSDRWMDWGIGFAYIGFNMAFTIALYYAIRVKKWGGEKAAPKPKKRDICRREKKALPFA